MTSKLRKLTERRKHIRQTKSKGMVPVRKHDMHYWGRIVKTSRHNYSIIGNNGTTITGIHSKDEAIHLLNSKSGESNYKIDKLSEGSKKNNVLDTRHNKNGDTTESKYERAFDDIEYSTKTGNKSQAKRSHDELTTVVNKNDHVLTCLDNLRKAIDIEDSGWITEIRDNMDELTPWKETKKPTSKPKGFYSANNYYGAPIRAGGYRKK